jgi:hypothetical protein
MASLDYQRLTGFEEFQGGEALVTRVTGGVILLPMYTPSWVKEKDPEKYSILRRPITRGPPTCFSSLGLWGYEISTYQVPKGDLETHAPPFGLVVCVTS